MPEYFGNWQIDQGIVERTDKHTYQFPISDFGKSGHDDRWNVIDMLVHLPEKTWITKQDLEDLNAAAQHAIKHLGIKVDPDIDWEATIQMQSDIFEMYHEKN